MTGATKVLLVDDHPVVREGLRGMIDAEADLTVVGEAGSGDEAVVMAESLRPDVILMDLLMPDVDGVSATERIVVLMVVLAGAAFNVWFFFFSGSSIGAN